MPIVVASKRASMASVRRRHPGALMVDVTSKGMIPWVRFSPFYPVGGIPIPFSPEYEGASVEGIWQGLKVFERADIDRAKLSNRTMKDLKRSSRSFGNVLGHRAGVGSDRLLPYVEARRQIYLPCYRWVLENRLQSELAELRRLSAGRLVALLDYETNEDVHDLRRPLSHASLVRQYLEDTWPE